MKLILENWNKFLKEQELQEATDEEIEYLRDAMAVPIEDYLFSNIFGDSYRIIEPLSTVKKDTDFGNAMWALQVMGWEVSEPSDGKILCSKVKTTHYVNPKTKQQGVKSKAISLNLPKVLAGIVNYIQNSHDNLADKYGESIHNVVKRYTATPPNTIGAIYTLPSEMMNPEYNVTADEYRSVMRFVDTQDYWIGMKYLGKSDDFVKEFSKKNINFAKLMNFAQSISDSFEDLLNNINQYYENNYIIYSRHPIDVFRMSDHQKITSCHSLPSGKYMKKFDEYNKCALSEAYGNGMIAYVVPASGFKEFPPTQESLDNLDDEEIFIDDKRPGVGSIEPTSRIRIKHVAFHRGGNENKEPIRIAVPQGKVYGPKVPGFIDAVNNKMTSLQKQEMQEIVKQVSEDDSKKMVFLSNFTRYGGSYQDRGYSVAEMLPAFFRKISKEITFVGSSVRYDEAVENALLAKQGAVESDADVRAEADRIFRENTGGLYSFNYTLRRNEDDEFYIDWSIIVTWRVITEKDASLEDFKEAVYEATDQFSEYYPFGDPSETRVIKTSQSGEEVYQFDIEMEFDIYDIIGSSGIPDNLEDEVPEAIGKLSQYFDHYYSDGAIQLVQNRLEARGILKTDRYNVDKIMQKYDLERDSWWPIEDKEYTENMFDGELYERVGFEDTSSVNLPEIFEKIPDNLKPAAYKHTADFLNLFQRVDMAGRVALNQSTYNKDEDPDIAILFDGPSVIKPKNIQEYVENEEEIDFTASVSLWNDENMKILEKTANFLKNDASIDDLSERIKEELEKYLGNMLKQQQSITENKKRIKIRVRR